MLARAHEADLGDEGRAAWAQAFSRAALRRFSSRRDSATNSLPGSARIDCAWIA